MAPLILNISLDEMSTLHARAAHNAHQWRPHAEAAASRHASDLVTALARQMMPHFGSAQRSLITQKKAGLRQVSHYQWGPRHFQGAVKSRMRGWAQNLSHIKISYLVYLVA